MKKEIEELVGSLADKIVFKRDGTVKFFRGYFHLSGNHAESYSEAIYKRLSSKYYVRLVEFGDVFKPFKGGAPVERQSHIWCIFSIEGKKSDGQSHNRIKKTYMAA